MKLYIELHHYIVSKHRTQSKTAIGNLYKMLDEDIHSTTRPYNIYRKIEKLYQKNKNSIIISPMGTTLPLPSTSTTTTPRISSTSPPLSGHYAKHSVDRRDKRHKILLSRYRHTQHSLQKTQSELGETTQKLATADSKLRQLQNLVETLFEDHYTEPTNLVDENRELKSIIEGLEKELAESTLKTSTCSSEENFTI